MVLTASHAIPMAEHFSLAREAFTPYFVAGAAGFVAAVLLALLFTAIVRKFAPWFRLVDHPDNHRKLHRLSTPLGGGLALYLSTVLVIGVLTLTANPWARHLQIAWRELAVLTVAGGILVVVGLFDDRYRLRGRVKLLGQCLAATVVVAGGMNIQAVSLFGYSFNLGPLAIPLTLLWLLGAVNSVNLLDGIDGLATILGLIMVTTIGVMAVLFARTMEGVIALVFAGSLIGFLRFNFPPASIFLGDAGSMLIGLVVGTLAISASLKGPGTVLLAAPLAVWTIPFFDSFAAILRRRLTGRSIYTTDRGHLHHRLLDLLGDNRRVLAVIAAFCLLSSAGTLLSMFLHNDLIAILACASVVVILVATGIFGRAEFSLVTSRLCQFGQSLLESSDGPVARARSSEVRLQGTKPWESLFDSLTGSAAKYALNEIRLNVNAPRSREGYHAHWEYPAADDLNRQWRLELPLIVNQQRIGHLLLVGQHTCSSAHQDLQQILILVQEFETMLQTIVEEQTPVVVIGKSGADESLQPVAPGADHLARKHPK